jgi:hypothetical protein
VVHPVRPAPWGISLWQQRKSQFNALLYKKHPQLYRERIPTGSSYHYYAILTALLLALGCLAAGHPGWALIPAVVWLMRTARFCARRLRGTSHALGHVVEMMITSVLIPPLSVFWRLWGAVKFRVLFL